MIAATLLAAVQGGDIFALLVAAVATLMFYEWTRIVKRLGRCLVCLRLPLCPASGAGAFCGSGSAMSMVSIS